MSLPGAAPLGTAMCEDAATGVANGVAGALQAVDCVAGQATTAAFGRLFGQGGALLSTLTVLLTLYVGFFAINLLTGRGSLGVRALAPKMMTLGLILTFATSWAAYSTVVWNLAVGAPDQIAGIITGSQGSATSLFAQKIDVVFNALLQASPQDAAAQAKAPPSAFSPEGMMWLGGMLFLLGTVGVLVTARIALAVLVMLGPVFVVMALFDGTRGLFAGWLKGLAMLALVPLFAVLGGSIMLELAVPVLSALLLTPGQIDPQAAMAFFVVGAVHAALMVMVMKVLGTMVGGWTVFGLAAPKGEAKGGDARVPAMQAAAAAAAPAGAAANDRRIPAASFGPPAAAASAPAAASADPRSRAIAGQVHVPGFAAPAATSSATSSRARGVGARFRAPAPRPHRPSATGTRP